MTQRRCMFHCVCDVMQCNHNCCVCVCVMKKVVHAHRAKCGECKTIGHRYVHNFTWMTMGPAPNGISCRMNLLKGDGDQWDDHSVYKYKIIIVYNLDRPFSLWQLSARMPTQKSETSTQTQTFSFYSSNIAASTALSIHSVECPWLLFFYS